MKDLRQGKKYADWLSITGFEVVKIKSSTGSQYGYVKRFLGIGMMKVQRYKGYLDLDDLKKVAKRKRILMVVLEPIDDSEGERLRSNGFSLGRDGYLPTKTLVKNVKSRLIVNENYKRIMKKYGSHKGVEIGEVSPEEWVEGYKREGKLWILNKKNLVLAKKAFGSGAIYWGAKISDQVVCGVMVLIEDDTAYYFSAFAGREARIRQLGVVSLMILIEELKRRGLSYLDFDGIYDERFPRSSWKGFSEFKRRFGGREIEYPGSFSILFYPWS